MQEDLAILLDSETHLIFEQKLESFNRLGVALVREGFRQLLQDNGFKLKPIIKKYKVFRRLAYQDNIENASEYEWVVRSIKFVAMGVSSPLVFF